MGLEENLAAARDALNAVRAMTIISTNRSSIRSGQHTGVRDPGRLGYVLRAMRFGLDHQLNLQETLFSAHQTRFMGVGNCAEMTEVVFEHLYVRGVRPIDIMHFTALGYDHQFVVIGLAETAGELRENPSTGLYRPNLRDWGPEAVWCDPWQGNGIAFPVADLIRGAVRNLDFRYRCHTAESVENGCPRSVLRVDDWL